MSIFRRVLHTLVLSTTGFSTLVLAQDYSTPRWFVESHGYSCSITYENEADDLMFAYQVQSSGDESMGIRPPGWNDGTTPAEISDGTLVVKFGESVVDIFNSPMKSKQVTWVEAFEPEDFKIFQDYESIEISMGSYYIKIPTEGLYGRRQEFADCLRKMAALGQPPNIDTKSVPQLFDILEPINMRIDIKLVSVRVDASGKPVSCRIIPKPSSDHALEKVCEKLLTEIEYVAGKTSEGEPIEKELVIFGRD